MDCTQWEYEEESGNVIIHDAELFHEYTVSFLAYIIWDPGAIIVQRRDE